MNLQAGPLTLAFDPVLGAARYVCLGNREVVRSVYVAVRDRTWKTIAPRIDGIHLSDDSDGTTLSYQAHALDGAIDFLWHGSIRCGRNGTIRVTFDGEARSTFWRNRIGLCVLHPIEECAGQPCTVTTSSGVVEGHFPALVAPHQPFIDISAIEYAADPGADARIRLAFEGDVFELEDQRNWGDASFKTYSTRLSLPMPVEVRAGTRLHQAVTISLAGPVKRGRAVMAAPASPFVAPGFSPATEPTVHVDPGVAARTIAPVGLLEPADGKRAHSSRGGSPSVAEAGAPPDGGALRRLRLGSRRTPGPNPTRAPWASRCRPH